MDSFLEFMARVAPFLLVITLYVVIGRYLSLYIQALLSGAGVSPIEFVRMRIRRADLNAIFAARISGAKKAIYVPAQRLEEHSRAGGSPRALVAGLIRAKELGVEITYDDAASVDLAGESVIEAVEARAAAADVA